MVVVSSCFEGSLKWGNERNPYYALQVSRETAQPKVSEEEGGDDVKSAWPFDALGYTRVTMALQWVANPRGGANPIKRGPSSDWRLQPASMKPESLVIADQPRCGEYVLESCTHCPSSQGSR
jgi:hypothetical protein